MWKIERTHTGKSDPQVLPSDVLKIGVKSFTGTILEDKLSIMEITPVHISIVAI